jgi:hypothetical protein
VAVHWSRSGIHTGHATLLTVLCAMCLVRGVRSGRTIWFALFGVGCGATLLTYNAALLAPAWLGLVIAICWLIRPRLLEAYATVFLVALISALVVLAPMIGYWHARPGTFLKRSSSLVFTSDGAATELTQKRHQTDFILEEVERNLSRAVLLLNRTGDSNFQFGNAGRGMVDPITGAGIVLGLGVALARLSDHRYWSLLLGLLLIWLVGAVLSTHGVQYSRIAGLALLVLILPALWARDLLNAAERARGRLGWAGAVALLAGLLVAAAWWNARIYFVEHDARYLRSRLPAWHRRALPSLVAREADADGPDTVVAVVSLRTIDLKYRSHVYLAGDRTVLLVRHVEDIPPPAPHYRRLVILLTNLRVRDQDLEELRLRYPGGTLNREPTPFVSGEQPYWRYEVTL